MIITWKQNWRSTCFVPLRSSGEITFWWHYFFRFESSISHTIIQLLGVSVNSIAVLIVAWMTVSSSSVLFLVCSNRTPQQQKLSAPPRQQGLTAVSLSLSLQYIDSLSSNIFASMNFYMSSSGRFDDIFTKFPEGWSITKKPVMVILN